MTRNIIFTMMVMRMVWYGEYGDDNEGDDIEQVDDEDNLVLAQLRGCVQWTMIIVMIMSIIMMRRTKYLPAQLRGCVQGTARELTHHCSHGTRCERTAEGEILKSGNGKVGNESIQCGFSNVFCRRKNIFD